MTRKDPAAARFAIINAVRLAGVACVALGLLIADGRLPIHAPAPFGYLLSGGGLIGVFVIPLMLARKWRTPK